MPVKRYSGKFKITIVYINITQFQIKVLQISFSRRQLRGTDYVCPYTAKIPVIL